MKKCFKNNTVLCLLVSVIIYDSFSSGLFLEFFVSTINKAMAATGDFSTYEEDIGTTIIDQTGVPLEVTWDQVVDTNANINLLGDNSSLDLSEGGKYLVLYNIWANDDNVGGTGRRSFNTYLTLDGNPLAYGRGAGYTRDVESLANTYQRSSAIIEASPGDDLESFIQRDDTNDNDGSEIMSGVNGISVLKLPDSADYLRSRITSTSSDISANTTFTDVAWDTVDELDTDSFGLTAPSANITLKGDDDDHFLVNANIGLFVTTGGVTRQNYEMRLTLDGNEIPGTRTTSFIRSVEGTWYGQLVYTGLITKDAIGDQTLNFEIRRESTGADTTVIMADRSAVSIMSVPETAAMVKLSDDSGTQTTSLTPQPLNFNITEILTSETFSHSTSTNSNRIEIERNGDYLFFATAYTQSSTAINNREPFRVDWLVSGVKQSRGGFGALNLRNQTFTGGASGAILLSDLTSSDYVSMQHVDETDSAPETSYFPADRIAVQGIYLDDSFYGLDVEVTATGTHFTETDIPVQDFYTGGKFIIKSLTGNINVTDIVVSETGTVDGSDGVKNIKLFYDIDTTAPYDCNSESYEGNESQFGDTDTNGFSGADGSSSFTSGSPPTISTTASLCVYPVLELTSSANDGENLRLQITNPNTDVNTTGSTVVGPSWEQEILDQTNLVSAELTQSHYHWLNDDGVEGSATSIGGGEDLPVMGFAEGVTRRLRMQVSAEGSTSSPPTSFRLEYGEKADTCEGINTWTEVGSSGADWDMSDTTHFASDGLDSSDLTVANGGTTNENSTHLTPNAALRDISSELDPLTFNTSNFLEMEFSIAPTVNVSPGTTYCFRVSDAGSDLKNYDVYAEGTVSADVNVSAEGDHVTNADAGAESLYLGGTFLLQRTGVNQTVSEITITETGTVDASSDLSNVELFYDLDTSAPYDCTSESFDGNELQFGSANDGFSGPNGTSTHTGNEQVGTNRTMCLYVLLNVNSEAGDGDTIKVEITDPSTDVVTGSSVGPSTTVTPTGETTISGPVLTQVHYHWRNDDGDESEATSATEGLQDTPIIEVPRETTKRIRLAVSNEGSISSQSINYQLQYGTKITTCGAIGNWTNVGASESAWDMSLSPNIIDGNTTDISDSALGAITNENTTFVGDGALRESTSQSDAITLNGTEFTELEYSIKATADSAFDTTYCFRVTDGANSLAQYNEYPEATTREKQDFFVQRGSVSVSGTSTTLEAGVDYEVPSSADNAFIRIVGTQITGSGASSGGLAQPARDVTAFIENPENITDSITIARPAGAQNDTKVSWEILEYIGVTGADNEMIIRDQGVVDYSTGQTAATGTSVVGVSDDSQIVVFITGQSNSDNDRSAYEQGLSTSDWSAGTDQPVFTRGSGADEASSVSYAVVEFTGLNWNVQRVENTYSSTEIETASIAPVSSLSRAFVHAQKQNGTGESGVDEIGHEVWLSSIGSLSFKLQPGVSNPSLHKSVAWVIENTQNGDGAMNVQRTNGILSATPFSCFNDPCIETVSINQVNDDNSSIWMTNRSNGSGTAFPQPMISLSLINDGSEIEYWRSLTGEDQTYRTAIIEWPVAEVSIRQNYYRFYVNSDTLTPTDPWPVGGVNLGENTTLTANDDPMAEGESIRLRMSLQINNASLPDNSTNFKLQYGLQNTTCSAISTWNDVGGPASGSIWRGYDTPVETGSSLSADPPTAGDLKLSISDVAGTYEEGSISAVNPYKVGIGEDIEYDWVLEHNGATQRSDYCFRMVESDGSLLDGYLNYPTIRTTGYTPVVTDWRWYNDENNQTPVSPLAGENTSPSNIASQDVVKLRVIAEEVENSDGVNVKFALQYSQYADFSDGGTILTATSTCTEDSVWCYADVAGDDNDIIEEAVLSSADSCVSGVGFGCGLRNEMATSSTNFTHQAGASTEFEFALQSVAARTNGVYYFRLLDVNSDEPVMASSSQPSLATEGAQLVFTVAGVDSGESIAGVVTDATTTPTSISFGSFVFGTSREAAHRITVDTNAAEGYKLFSYSTQQLINSFGESIPDISSTNASPASWASACSDNETGCFGYHSTDATLDNASGRFGPIDSYAALDTTPREIMYSSLPTVDVHEVVYRVEVTESQPAGDYQTDVVYIAVPTF